MKDYYQLAKESRQITCTVKCENCDFVRHCDYCGDNFCGLYTDFSRKTGEVICVECKDLNYL